jgi:hypothetical protein
VGLERFLGALLGDGFGAWELTLLGALYASGLVYAASDERWREGWVRWWPF